MTNDPKSPECLTLLLYLKNACNIYHIPFGRLIVVDLVKLTLTICIFSAKCDRPASFVLITHVRY